jgi:hypothetical protein
VNKISEHNESLGKARTGKSKIMKFALNSNQEAKADRTIIISFFFNARGEDLEKSTMCTDKQHICSPHLSGSYVYRW